MMAEDLPSLADLNAGLDNLPSLADLNAGLEKPLSWSQVPGKALSNAPHSAYEFGKAVAQPFMHPVETAGNLAAIGSGVIQHLGLGDQEDTEDKDTASAAGKFLVDRYGSVEGIKKTLATDPVGVAADLSTILGGTGLTRAAGSLAGKAARGVGRGAAELAGLQTGVGSEPLMQAARAGYEGGEAAKAFRANITGAAPMEEAVRDAQNAVKNLRQQRSAAYTEGMRAVGEVDTPLDFSKIDDALARATEVKTFHGISLEPETQAIRQKIGKSVAAWKALEPEVYHTPEGLDALKQRVGSIRDNTDFGTPARKVADDAYHAIRQTIVDEAPEYGRVMKGYEEASKQIQNLQRELSVPTDKGNIDTSLRKLQSVLRNNVNTSFGRRKELAQFLVDNGSPELMYKLAGQALNPIAPRGLQRLATSIGLEVASLLGLGTVGGIAAAHLAPAAALLPMTSPRLMGEAAYWGGRGARAAAPAASAARAAGLPAFQLGRIASPQGFRSGGRVTRSFRYKS